MRNGCLEFSVYLHRSGENSRPFTIACFEEEDEEGARGEKDEPSVNLDTSDYHSATSSDCSSTSSSDTEEDEKEVVKEESKEGETFNIVMVPRIRKRHGEGPNKVKYLRNMVLIVQFSSFKSVWGCLCLNAKAGDNSLFFLLSEK